MKFLSGSVLVLALSLGIMVINLWFIPLNEGLIRANGVIMLVALAAVVFGVVRQGKER